MEREAQLAPEPLVAAALHAALLHAGVLREAEIAAGLE
eukprot:COSAG01_NODE_227_length_21107_cov_85.615099_11_plen_38_part_00